MERIEPVTTQSPPEVLDQVRALFRAYGEFLRHEGGPALLCFSRLNEEILDLPAPYTGSNGELLLALNESSVIGCIAYRSLDESGNTNCCEIKRLFVSPVARGQGVGKRLVEAALERARQRGYRTACLDTEPKSMAVAKQMYLDLGFAEDGERNSRHRKEPVIFLKRPL